MADIVFILGAGASAHAGVPVMAKFLDRVRRIGERALAPPWRGYFDHVTEALSDLQRVHSKAVVDLNNLEAIFTTIELASLINKLPGQSQDFIPDIANALRAVIVHTIESDMRLGAVDGQNTATPVYGRFVRILKKLHQPRPLGQIAQTVAVITFNYDTGLDIAFTGENVPFTYALVKTAKIEKEIPYLKLHGSINWGLVEKTDEIVPLDVRHLCGGTIIPTLTERKATGFTASMRQIASESFAPCFYAYTKIVVRDTPVIVPPGIFKSEYQGSLGNVWQQAAKELAEAREICVIGYSLPESDLFFRNLFALGTEGPTILERFAVVNYDNTGVTEKRFKSLLGPGAIDRFEYHAVKFEESFPVLATWFGETQ